MADRYHLGLVAPRRRTPLLAVLAGLLAVALGALAPAAAGAQTDPGASFGGGATSTTVPGASTTVAASPTTTGKPGQTLVETAKPPEKRLATESRRVMAIIGALIFVALALTVLTIRYVRVTKPVRVDAADAGAADTAGIPAPATAPVTDAPAAVASTVPDGDDSDAAPTRRSTRRSRRSVAGADHAAADADWEPRGTGEHAVVEPASAGAAAAGTARPGRKARKLALGRSADA